MITLLRLAGAVLAIGIIGFAALQLQSAMPGFAAAMVQMESELAASAVLNARMPAGTNTFDHLQVLR